VFRLIRGFQKLQIALAACRISDVEGDKVTGESVGTPYGRNMEFLLKSKMAIMLGFIIVHEGDAWKICALRLLPESFCAVTDWNSGASIAEADSTIFWCLHLNALT
jgi:hypothetical protein